MHKKFWRSSETAKLMSHIDPKGSVFPYRVYACMQNTKNLRTTRQEMESNKILKNDTQNTPLFLLLTPEKSS